MSSHQLSQIINSANAGEGILGVPRKGGFLLNHAMSHKPYFMSGDRIIPNAISDEGDGPSAVHFAIEVVPGDHAISTPKLRVCDDFEKGRFELLLVGVCEASK